MRLTTGAPLLIFALQTENDMKSLAPAQWKNHKGPLPAGLFDHGWEKQFAIVRIDQDVPGAYNVVYHEYVHTLLHSNFRWLPTWLDEGLAEFYGNTRFEPKKSYVGAPSTRVYRLQNRTLITLETLLIVNPWSYYRGDENQIATFYAESWALVHYLVFGPDMELGKKLSRFYAQLQAGDHAAKGLPRRIRRSENDVEDGLQKYIQAFAFHAYSVENLTAIQEKDFSARKLTKAETDCRNCRLSLVGTRCSRSHRSRRTCAPGRPRTRRRRMKRRPSSISAKAKMKMPCANFLAHVSWIKRFTFHNISRP